MGSIFSVKPHPIRSKASTPNQNRPSPGRPGTIRQPRVESRRLASKSLGVVRGVLFACVYCFAGDWCAGTGASPRRTKLLANFAHRLFGPRSASERTISILDSDVDPSSMAAIRNCDRRPHPQHSHWRASVIGTTRNRGRPFRRWWPGQRPGSADDRFGDRLSRDPRDGHIQCGRYSL